MATKFASPKRKRKGNIEINKRNNLHTHFSINYSSHISETSGVLDLSDSIDNSIEDNDFQIDSGKIMKEFISNSPIKLTHKSLNIFSPTPSNPNTTSNTNHISQDSSVDNSFISTISPTSSPPSFTNDNSINNGEVYDKFSYDSNDCHHNPSNAIFDSEMEQHQMQFAHSPCRSTAISPGAEAVRKMSPESDIYVNTIKNVNGYQYQNNKYDDFSCRFYDDDKLESNYLNDANEEIDYEENQIIKKISFSPFKTEIGKISPSNDDNSGVADRMSTLHVGR